jgi:hypothetical protein
MWTYFILVCILTTSTFSDELIDRDASLNNYAAENDIMFAFDNKMLAKNQQDIRFSFGIERLIYRTELWGKGVDLKFFYNQFSFWALNVPGIQSAAFRENNYNPGCLVAINFPGLLGVPYFGIEHESNGNQGSDSRGWNRAYVGIKGIDVYTATNSFVILNFLYSPFSWGIEETNLGIEGYSGLVTTNFRVYIAPNWNYFNKFIINLRFNSFVNYKKYNTDPHVQLNFQVAIHKSFKPNLYFGIENGAAQRLLINTESHFYSRTGMSYNF